MKKTLIAVPIGDPAGIGPEIVAKAVADTELFRTANCIVIGDGSVMENAIRITGVNLSIHTVADPAGGDYREHVLNLIDLHNMDMERFLVFVYRLELPIHDHIFYISTILSYDYQHL